MSLPTTQRRPGKHEAALRLLPEGAQIADQVWAGSPSEAKTTARQMALHAGSSAAALRDFGPHRNEVGDAAIRAALYDLQAMEESRAPGASQGRAPDTYPQKFVGGAFGQLARSGLGRGLGRETGAPR